MVRGTSMYTQSLIPFETALRIADAAVFTQASRHLKNIEVVVLQGVWQGQKYDQIAEECGYAPEYIKNDVGPKLWQLLSCSLGEKVNKTNLMAVLAQRANLISVQDSGATPTEAIRSSRNTDLDASAIDPERIDSIPELPVGLVPLNSPLYVPRPPVESRCYREVMRPGTLIRLKAPHQMGKTSLMVRILAHAKQQANARVQTVALNLQQADRNIFTNLDRFLRWFCAAIARKLHLANSVESDWSDTFGSKSNCTAYFEDYILPSVDDVLVLALDQVDEVFLHPEIADDFFTLLRSWYEEAAYGDSGNPLWKKLRLIIIHSTEVYIPLDINKSPFNVGLAIELQAFSSSQVYNLAQRYGLQLTEPDLVELMQLVAGHPALIQQALFHLTKGDLTLTQLIQTAPTDAGIYRNHLHRHLQYLQAHPELAAAYKQVIHTSEPIELDQLLTFKLHSIGLVEFRGNQVISSCELYHQYFQNF